MTMEDSHLSLRGVPHASPWSHEPVAGDALDQAVDETMRRYFVRHDPPAQAYTKVLEATRRTSTPRYDGTLFSWIIGVSSAVAAMLLVNLVLQLRNPDFSTSIRIADTVNAYAASRFGGPIAEAKDSQEVAIDKPKMADLTRLMADLENLEVQTDTPAKVVINERTGTIVIGADVRVSPVAVSYGTLTVQVSENPQIIQPEPFSNGRTAVQDQTDITAQKSGGRVAVLEGPDLKTLVSGLNNIGVKPDGIIAILQGIKSAGALQAELVLQ